MTRKLRTVTDEQLEALERAKNLSVRVVAALRVGGASSKLIDAARSMRQRTQGAHRHAIRARIDQEAEP